MTKQTDKLIEQVIILTDKIHYACDKEIEVAYAKELISLISNHRQGERKLINTGNYYIKNRHTGLYFSGFKDCVPIWGTVNSSKHYDTRLEANTQVILFNAMGHIFAGQHRWENIPNE